MAMPEEKLLPLTAEELDELAELAHWAWPDDLLAQARAALHPQGEVERLRELNTRHLDLLWRALPMLNDYRSGWSCPSGELSVLVQDVRRAVGCFDGCPVIGPHSHPTVGAASDNNALRQPALSASEKKAEPMEGK